jgi:mono/diheme cytochrome c family protein
MIRNKRIAAVVFGVAALSAGVFAAARAQDAPPAGDAAKGKKIFLTIGCFTCHGRSGQGGAYNGPAPILAHTMLPFDGFKGQIRNPADDMPAFPPAVLSDQDIADIYAFVETLPGAGSAKDHPILND